jgi:hypothetical protein
MREENHKYADSIYEFPCNLIQAYANDVILGSNSIKCLQKLIDDVNTFSKFASIKFVSKKCEIFVTDRKGNSRRRQLKDIVMKVVLKR